MTTVLTGLRTNSEYHIGNYIGAILPMIEIQKNLKPNDSFYLFLPDLHSLESSNTKTVNQNSLENARLFFALGIDTTLENVFVYRQSRISEHSELEWILNWYTYMGEATRMIQYKEKSQLKGESIPVSLLTYPVLQAADILLYDADIIPVGEDQRQHLELTRDIAVRFNNKQGDIFTIPKPWTEQLEFTHQSEGLKVRSLTDPTKKMSKSDPNPNSYILLSDSPELCTKKIMSSTTDSIGMIEWNWEVQPGITNLLQMLALFTNTSKDQVIAEWQGVTKYGDLKKSVAEAVSIFLKEIQIKLKEYSLESSQVLLETCEAKVKLQATKKLLEVHKAIGLL